MKCLKGFIIKRHIEIFGIKNFIFMEFEKLRINIKGLI